MVYFNHSYSDHHLLSFLIFITIVLSKFNHLNPSVHPISAGDVSAARNNGGGTYSPCEKCKPPKNPSGGMLYITDYGRAYHSDINCKEIKHNIKKVLYEDVKDKMRPCSKCAAGKH